MRQDADTDPMKDIDLVEPPAGVAWPWPVHRTGSNDDLPVVVMQEIFGFSPDYTAFCRKLARRGFTVWMPRIAGGAPNDTPGKKWAAARDVCISREFDTFRSGHRSRVVDPLRDFVQDVSRLHGGGLVGVVGMCLTGGFALAMAADPTVGAAVAAQPSIPFRPVCGWALGMSREDLDEIARRNADDEVGIFYTRFKRDLLSTRQRHTALVKKVGPVTYERVDPPGLYAHPVLSLRPEAGSPAEARLERIHVKVADFLRARLQGSDDRPV